MSLKKRFRNHVERTHQLRSDILFRLIQPHVNGRLLDFGFGNGLFLHHLNQAFTIEPFGVDIVSNQASAFPAVCYGGRTLPFRSRVFDTVIALFVLHHTPDPENALAECLRVCRGKMILIEDLKGTRRQNACLLAAHRLFDAAMCLATRFSNRRWYATPHYQFRSNQEWHAIFSRLGAEVIDEQGLVLLPRYPVEHRIFVLTPKEGNG